MLTVRVSQAGVDAVDQLAARHGCDRSEMLRRLLAFAVANYRPPRSLSAARRRGAIGAPEVATGKIKVKR